MNYALGQLCFPLSWTLWYDCAPGSTEQLWGLFELYDWAALRTGNRTYWWSAKQKPLDSSSKKPQQPTSPPEEPFRKTVQHCTLFVSGSCPDLWQFCPALLSSLGFIVQTMTEPVHLGLSVINISPWPGSLAVHCRRWVIHFHNTVNNKHIGSVICVRNYKSGADFSKELKLKVMNELTWTPMQHGYVSHTLANAIKIQWMDSRRGLFYN